VCHSDDARYRSVRFLPVWAGVDMLGAITLTTAMLIGDHCTGCAAWC
jgi:hypothetical protein